MQHNTDISMMVSVHPLSPLRHLSILTPTTMMNIMRIVKRMVKKENQKGCEWKNSKMT